MSKRKASIAKPSPAGKKGRSFLTLDGIVSQKVYDNFKDLAAEEVDSNTNEVGDTLRQALTKDVEKDRSDPGSVTFGCHYHEHLRQIFQRSKPLWEELESIKALGGPEAAGDLVHAVKLSQKAKADRNKVTDW